MALNLLISYLSILILNYLVILDMLLTTIQLDGKRHPAELPLGHLGEL